ncbi:MAG: 5'/3'-nucleotidase SurE [Fimbriimonadaceae bacterium]|nr:5'/3'-nucleotidase SurE [Fimbriimonadaceae bacterium]
MRILITNDDGIRAEGLRVLARVAKQFGEVKIAAPDRERSACSHAMTLRDPIRAVETAVEGCQAWEVDGFPVDCVNVGLELGWPEGCDLVLSGVNYGPNLGFDTTYSGTVAGAMEGAINGIFSIAVSMAIFVSGAPPHFATGEQWLCENMERLLRLPRKRLTFLNVNIPAIAFDGIAGAKMVGMGERVYEERLVQREDPWGRPYYWQGGVVVMNEEQAEKDVAAINDGYVTVTPVTLDWTDHAYLEEAQREFEEQ